MTICWIKKKGEVAFVCRRENSIDWPGKSAEISRRLERGLFRDGTDRGLDGGYPQSSLSVLAETCSERGQHVPQATLLLSESFFSLSYYGAFTLRLVSPP